MKTNVKVLLEVTAIVIGTSIGVHLVYELITYIRKDRALRIGTIHTNVLQPARGNIHDACGRLLACTDTTYDLHLDCAVLMATFRDSAHRDSVTGQLASCLATVLTQKDSAAWQEHIYTGCKNGNKYLRIAKGVSKKTADEVKSFPVFRLHPFRGGGIIEPVYQRIYPFGMLGRSTIGDNRHAVRKYGLERSYDSVLSGREGRKTLRCGRYEGHSIKKVSEYIPAKDGCDIYLTLNIDMQAAADSILRAEIKNNEEIAEGCFVLMEKNGAIRAMVNLSQTEDGLFELRNMAIEKLCSPGSIGQIMTYAALLGDGYIHSFSDTIATRNGLIMRELPRDEHIVDYERRNSASSISIRDGFAMSSRYVPGMLANKYYGDAPEKFSSRIQSFLPDFTFDLDGLRKNVFPEPGSRVWCSRDLPVMAYGYGLFVTPLGCVSYYNAILNQGNIEPPFLVERIVEKGVQVKLHETVSLGQIMPEHVADTLLRELRYASCSDEYIGMSSMVRIPTSNNNRSEKNAKYAYSSIGFFPEPEPRYTVICMLYTKATNKSFYRGKRAVENVVNEFAKRL